MSTTVRSDPLPGLSGAVPATSAALWFALVLALAATGGFEVPPGDMPLAILFAVLAPPMLFLIWYRLSPAVRAWVGSLDLTLVTAAQSWRIGGLLFVPLGIYGLLPLGFALPAGLGDALVGLIAPFVARAVERRTPLWRRASAWLIGLGLLDFVAAVGTGVATSPAGFLYEPGDPTGLLSELPLVMIPAFLVPMWIILHLIAWIRIVRD